MPTNRPDTATTSTDSTPAKYIWRTVSRSRASCAGERAKIRSRNRLTAPSERIKPRVFAPRMRISSIV